MWIFKVGKFECIDIWLVLSKRNKRNKIVRLFRIVIEFKKKKKNNDCWKEMIKAKERNVNVGIKITVGKKNYRWNHAKFEKKEASWKKNNKKILKNNILIKQ